MTNATIMMQFPNDMRMYPYGTYPFNTNAEQNRVNEIAMQVRDERDCWIFIQKNEVEEL